MSVLSYINPFRPIINLELIHCHSYAIKVAMNYGFPAFLFVIDYNLESSSSLYGLSSLRKIHVTFTAFFLDFVTIYN